VRLTLPPIIPALFLCCVLAATVPANIYAGLPSFQAASQPEAKIDVATYASQLESYIQSIDANRHQPGEIERLRRSIPAEITVHTADSDIKISNEWLRAELWNLQHRPKEADAIAARLKQHLSAMRAAAEQMQSESAAPEDARTQLDNVFARREFRELAGPNALQRLIARIERWFFDQITRLLNRLHINAKAGNVVAWTVIGIAFAFLCYWLWKRLRLAAVPMKAAAGQQPAPSRTSRQWLDDALAAAERGDYREAIHCGYWAAITRLEDSGMLTRDRSRTPRESLRKLDSRPREQKPLRDLTHHFELIWYGYRPATAADWSGARTQLEQMGCLQASTAPTANS